MKTSIKKIRADNTCATHFIILGVSRESFDLTENLVIIMICEMPPPHSSRDNPRPFEHESVKEGLVSIIVSARFGIDIWDTSQMIFSTRRGETGDMFTLLFALVVVVSS